MRSNTKRFFAIALAVLVAVFALAACDLNNGDATDPQSQQTQQNNDAATRLHKAVPYPKLVNSQELHNQYEWYTRLDDPNKVAYIYLFSAQGRLVAEYQIIAKCSSTNSDFSTPAQVEEHNSQYGGGNVVLPAPQPDGSYGQNENAVFCFLNDSNRTMIEFSETWSYLWSETPLHLSTAPDIVVVPNGK